MPPVPPSFGNLNSAFGPHPPCCVLVSTLEIALLTSAVATRSPSQLHCISVVGYAHTLKLYGRMNMSFIPAPITHSIHSSKFAGLVVRVAVAHFASTRPVRHAIWSSTSSAEMLFWKGYAIHLEGRQVVRVYTLSTDGIHRWHTPMAQNFKKSV